MRARSVSVSGDKMIKKAGFKVGMAWLDGLSYQQTNKNMTYSAQGSIQKNER